MLSISSSLIKGRINNNPMKVPRIIPSMNKRRITGSSINNSKRLGLCGSSIGIPVIGSIAQNIKRSINSEPIDNAQNNNIHLAMLSFSILITLN